jgi:alpha-tubulin suppressor-like RCC1 family protein
VNTWANISLRERHALAIQTTGTLWAWGSNTAGAVGNSSAAALVSTPIQIGSATNWSEVAAGVATSMAIKSDGTLWAWGNNDKGQLGIGTTTNVSSPVRVGTTTWTKVSTADYITAAVRSDGTMWVWGMLDGFTSYGTVSTPIQIQSETVWVDVKVGPNYIMLVKNDTSVWTMGVNFYGQMGSSIEARYSSPVQMGSATNWKKISFQDYAGVAAIKTDNTLWNWGWIYWVDTLAYSFYRLKTPVQVGTATDWADVKAIACNFLALKSTGTLWSWGLNRAKNGLSTALGDSSTPSQIGALTTWSKIAMNTTSSYGIKRDGTLWSWGAPLYGELGQGASSGGSSPVQVGSSTLWTDISAHSYSALAIEWPGKAYGWGINDFGQIGISSLTNVSTPVQIGTKFDWKKVFAGAHSGYGRRDI